MLTSYITTYNRNPCSGYCNRRNDIRKGLIAGPGTLTQERYKTDAGHETQLQMMIVVREQLQPSRGITATSLDKMYLVPKTTVNAQIHGNGHVRTKFT